MRHLRYTNKLRLFQEQLRSNCENCRTSEIIDSSCACFKELIRINSFLRADIPEKYWQLDLENLNKPITAPVKKAIASYIADLETKLKSGRGAYIWSPRAQSGKSTLGYIILKAAIQAGKKVFKVTINDCTTALDRRPNDEEESLFIRENIFDSDLLLIDNLGDMNTLVGTPPFLKSNLEQVYTLRTNNNQATILTSNLPINQLTTVFGTPFDEAVQHSAEIILIP